WAVSLPVRHYRGGIDPEGMRLSAQVASNLAALLLVVPMFLLAKTLFDRRIAFWGTLLFHCLPASAHLLSDGLSESLFLLLTFCGLLCAVRGLRGSSLKPFIWCGVFAGLSYLTRPEGLLLVAAVVFTLFAVQVRAAWSRRSESADGNVCPTGSRMLLQTAALLATVLV